MNITLETVRDVLRDAFGRESYLASGFISRVEATETCPTASIDTNGTMRYNPEFVEQHVTSRQDLFSLICHETLHPVLGHLLVGSNNPLDRIGADAVINGIVTVLFEDASGAGALFERLYPPTGIEGILRPHSRMNASRYSKLYAGLYASHAQTKKLTTGEVIQSLKVLTPSDAIPPVLLLGSHGDGDGNKTAEGHSPDVMSKIASDFRRSASIPHRHGAGYGESLFDLFVEVLKTHLSMKKVLLQKFATRKKVDRFKEAIEPRIAG